MKLKQIAVLILAVGVFATPICFGQDFNSGSNGSYGALDVSSDTILDLPSDGIFHCTTITVADGATLQFNRNPLNTPVYLLATGNVNIAGTIDVSGKQPVDSIGGEGGPGGFDGGFGGSGLDERHGAGFGPGGGKENKSSGTFATNYANALLVPLIGGSGGAGADGQPNYGGGGGGGAILLASNTKITVDGSILALGANISFSGSGSGGAIRLVAPVVSGSGRLDTSGDFDRSFGRIRIDCADRLAFRSLRYDGFTTRGSQMFVFPSVIPRLDIVEVAGKTIPQGTPVGVKIQLPLDTPSTQPVRIQARGFTNDIPINVVVTPENGPSKTFPATIALNAGNPPQAIVNIEIPPGVVSHIHAWTR